MNEFFWFLLGFFLGAVATYFGIIQYAKYMEKSQKEAAIKSAKEKWGNQ